MTRKLALIAFLTLLLYSGWNRYRPGLFSQSAVTANESDQILASAFKTQRSNFQVEGTGEVTRVLADDNDGGRHQRFIVRLPSGQTLLIAHNIDLAPRIPGLKSGDTVQFNGEYEWNRQGGVIHWTHRDPAGRHLAGWIKHGGRTYQ